jgi:4a-hydroxytetrahydrobiopterin dehydratase
MARPPVLDAAALDAALGASDAPRWDLVDGQLVKVVDCASFPSALDFVQAVGRLAEEADHHPDIDIRWNRVTLRLVTHDSGGLTRLDLDLARAVRVLADATLPGPGS